MTQQLLHHDPAIACTCKANDMPYRIFLLFSIRFHRTHVYYYRIAIYRLFRFSLKKVNSQLFPPSCIKLKEKVVPLQQKQEKHDIMEDLVLSVPVQDAAFIETLALRMGWKMRRRRTSIERFINSCPKDVPLSDEEIQEEVNAVRYGR